VTETEGNGNCYCVILKHDVRDWACIENRGDTILFKYKEGVLISWFFGPHTIPQFGLITKNKEWLRFPQMVKTECNEIIYSK
jgi:hypothetical protein